MEKNKRNKKKIRLIIANVSSFMIICLGLYFIITKYFHIMDDNYTNSAQIEQYINPINTRIPAYIKEIRFIEHQIVQKGDTLVIFDNREILTQVEQAEAAYMNAKAQRHMASSSVKTVSNNVSVVDANIEGAKARLWNAEQNLKRYENLLTAEAVTRQQYDQIKTEYQALKASYDVLVKQKNTASLSITEAEDRYGVIDSEIKRTKSILDMAKLNLSYTIITAPYDGIMGRRLISDGQLMQAGQQIATIVLNGQTWVTANFLEKQMHRIAIGDKMNITVDALNGKTFEGKITAISAATGSRYAAVPVDNSTGNFIKVQQRIPVRIEFTDNNPTDELQQLRAGMNVNITLK